MKNQSHTTGNDLSTLAEDARALMIATADVVGDKVGKARKRLAVALEHSQEIHGRVREKEVEGATATDVAVHEHPYQAIAVGVGVGIIMGYLISHSCSHNNE